MIKRQILLRILKIMMSECGVGKVIGLSRGVLALSHRKQSEDFCLQKPQDC